MTSRYAFLPEDRRECGRASARMAVDGSAPHPAKDKPRGEALDLTFLRSVANVHMAGKENGGREGRVGRSGSTQSSSY